MALALLLGHILDNEGVARDAALQVQGRVFVADDRLGPVDLPQFGLEGGRRLALDRDLEDPVLLGDKGLPFPLTVHDEPQGDGLDTAG